MVNACADPDFFVRGGGGGAGGGGGSKPNGEKTALIFLCLFWGSLVQNFPGMRGGVQLFTRGGGVQMLISIEFDRTCDLPGTLPPPPTPPPPSGSAHA